MKKKIYSICMECGAHREKGTKDWINPAFRSTPAVSDTVDHSHGYCPGCAEIVAERMLAEV